MPATNAKFESEWFEGVEILYYASNDNEAQGSFYEDCLLALAHAKSRDDSGSADRIWYLWLVYLEKTLRGLHGPAG